MKPLIPAVSGEVLAAGRGTDTGPVFDYGTGNTRIFGPETGIVGPGLNLVFAAALWRWLIRPTPPS